MGDTPRYTARQVADDVAAGMDPDVELVAAQYCDAYEARIAELEAKLEEAKGMAIWEANARCEDDATHTAELARVRAESLRVVPVGEAVRLGGCWLEEGEVKNFIHDGQVQYIDPEDGLQVDMNHEECGSYLTDDTIVQPVRLERWENPHDNH